MWLQPVQAVWFSACRIKFGAMDQPHNSDMPMHDRCVIGPFPLPQKGDYILKTDRAEFKAEHLSTCRVSKRPGWQEWMYTIQGPHDRVQACRTALLARFDENRKKPKPPPETMAMEEEEHPVKKQGKGQKGGQKGKTGKWVWMENASSWRQHGYGYPLRQPGYQETGYQETALATMDRHQQLQQQQLQYQQEWQQYQQCQQQFQEAWYGKDAQYTGQNPCMLPVDNDMSMWYRSRAAAPASVQADSKEEASKKKASKEENAATVAALSAESAPSAGP